MLKHTSLILMALSLLVTSCTGGKNASIDGPGSLKIAPGDTLSIDLQDVLALNIPDFTLSLRSVSPDFSTSKVLLDFTSLVSAQLATSSKVQFIIPKNIGMTRPLLVVADIPSLNTQLLEVIYDGDTSSRPGIASSLTYNLLKYYPGKTLADYSGSDFHGIQKLIQARADQLVSESEHLNLSTLPYPKIIRYFTNGVAFNINFLNQIRQFGVNYTFDLTTPPGLVAADTPEQSLTPYQYATNFKLGGVPALANPFNHTNNPPMLTPGVSQPNPGANLYITEGNPISVTAQGFDIDDDFIDKDMIIQYIPRVLPQTLTSKPGFPIIPEPTPQYTVLTQQTDPAGTDFYGSPKIAFNEALDTAVYPNTLPVDAALYPTPGAVPATAYRNIYYLISDGMIRVPYRWNFKYADMNRQPQIVRDSNGNMNDTHFDSGSETILGQTVGPIALGETEVVAGTGWKVHGSHCESNSLFSYQTITQKSDGPWSCAIRMTDPDIDDDPNAAADNFYYTLTATDNSTTILVNGQQLWPKFVAPFVADRIQGAYINNCITPDGKMHYRCGVGLYQIVIDNSVKAAAESKTSQSYNLDLVIYDRDITQGGNSTTANIGRTIQLLPQPARLVNFSDPAPTAAQVGFSVEDLLGQNFMRKDIYLSEVLNLADPSLTNLSDIGIGNAGLISPLASTPNRAPFMQGTANEISSFASQPHAITGGSVTLDPVTFKGTSATPGSLTLLGHSMTSADVGTYNQPYEFDRTCSLPSNNKGVGWDQDAQGGWTFEIDAVDNDNIGLSVKEASDPVHVSLATDIGLAGVQYCNYLSPNADPAYYQTYKATASAPAVNPETCTWTATPPGDLQPIPNYYTASVAGVSVVKKWVYHRMRFKWQPRDQGLTGGKTVAADNPPFFIKNKIMAGMKLFGNRNLLKGDTLDKTLYLANDNPAFNFNLYANRKDMKPCLTGLVGKAGIVHQLSPDALTKIIFSIGDENKVLAKTPTVPGALMGRFEAELKTLGTRKISDANFLQLVPYLKNCTTRDVDLTSTPTTPPATVGGSEPAIWYSQAGDAGMIPRVRLQTSTDPALNPFCMDYSINPARNQSNLEYNEVILIQNKSASAFNLSNSFFTSNCASRTSLALNPDQQYIAIAGTCGSGHTANQVLWNDSNSSGTVSYLADPTAISNGGLPLGTSLKLDLLPAFYQADLAKNFPADFNLSNAIFFEASFFDNFRLNSVSGLPEYTGYINSGAPKWLANDSGTTLINASVQSFPAPGYAAGAQVVDLDNQPNYLSLVTTTPTPDPNLSTTNVYYRIAPGDSNRIQVYVKNHATANFTMKVADAPFSNLETDPYDIMTYALIPPGSPPAALPSFTGVSRADCISAPAGYPAASTLNVAGLKDYKACSFAWTPTTAEDGGKYPYSFSVQDNFNASSGVYGVGGRHPASASGIGYSIDIPNDGIAATNGPKVAFNLDIESLETNTPPFFTNAGGTTTAYPYTGAGSAGWTSVYPGGTQSSCTPPSSGFSCGLAISNGDTLQSTAPVTLTEGAQQTFTVYAKDNGVTPQLKTLTATTPTKVLIVDGPHQGNTFIVPSFATMTLSTTQSVPPGNSPGTASFSFTWTPTDSEANYLSNAGGFLIPVTVSDQTYSPASDSGFPNNFKTPALQSTVWIWAKLSVVNQQPQVYYLNSGGAEIPLDSATLTLQTGGTTLFTIRVKDTDTARWTQTGDYSGFNPNYSGPAFTSFAPASLPTLSGNYIVQDFVVSGTPGNTDIGSYSSPQVSVTDPGDQSLGLAINPDASTPPKAKVFSSGNLFSVPFIMQVVGKPQFLAPAGAPVVSQAYAFASQPFTYPLALSISRQSELGQSFFVGIDKSTAETPIKKTLTGATSKGIYVSYVGNSVSNNFILKWPDASALDIRVSPSPDRVVPLYGVKSAYCGVNDGGTFPALTLIRYNETTSAIETCLLSTNNLNTNASNGSLTITLVDNTALANPVASLATMEVDRNFSPTPTPANFADTLSKQFADFYGRCTNCNVLPTPTCNGTANNPSSNQISLTGVTTTSQTCPEPGTGTLRTGFIEYDYNSYVSRYVYDTAAGFSVSKIYQDTAPAGGRSLAVMASKGETVHFMGNTSVPASNQYQYRWYVNGCLKSSGLLGASAPTFDYKITSQMGGLSNDCTGEYGFAEPGSATLGKLVVRLSLVKGNEILTASSEASVTSYLWNVSVINSDPSIITTSTYLPSTPVSLTSQFTGNNNVQFASPIRYGTKNYFAYTDLSSSTGLKVKLTELDTTGNIAAGGSNLALNCDSSFTSQPQWIGFQPQPQAGGNLFISASNNASYPISGANIAYSAKNQTCFTNTLNTSSPSVSPLVYGSGGSTVPAGYLGLSKYSLSLRALASYTVSGTIYQSGTNDVDYYLIDGQSASSQFWSYPLSNMTATTPPEFTTPYASNFVRRNIVSGNNLFQLVGANAPNSAGTRGFILPRTITSATNRLVSSGTNHIMFSTSASAPDCTFDGTPLDGVYVPTLNGVNVDTLFVLVSGTTSGKLFAIRNITGVGGVPTCADLNPSNLPLIKSPSLLDTEHNPNLGKMVYDATRGTIYGIISPGGGAAGQFYSLDVYSEQIVTRDLSATLSPYELIYSSGINGLYLFDNRKSTSPLLSPTLYKVW